jgi:hypothetical protein
MTSASNDGGSGQADPRVAKPLTYGDRGQAELDPIDVRHLGQVRSCNQLAVEVIGPGVLGALEGAPDLT